MKNREKTGKDSNKETKKKTRNSGNASPDTGYVINLENMKSLLKEAASPEQIRRFFNMAPKETPEEAKRRKKKEAREALRAKVRERLYTPKPVNVNKEIFLVALFFTLLFAGFTAFYILYIQSGREEYITSPYNRRQEVLEETVMRGKILSGDGETLAYSYMDEEGKEQRSYPYGSLFAHAVGYASNGRSALEASHNYYLITSHVNVIDQIRSDLQGVKKQGDNLVTTLSLPLQQAASEAMGSYRGAVIALEPSTGKVLALVSQPGFDPNLIEDAWDSLVSEENTEANLMNRATQGLYPPGSVFKILTALEYRHEVGQQGIDSFEYVCDGVFSDGSNSLACYNWAEHGYENFRDAFANSCNGAFCEIGLKLDRTKFARLCRTLFFNEDFSFSLATTSGQFKLEENSTSWQIMQTAIGQGETLVTPLQMALITCGIANGGRVMKPYLADRVESAEGELIKQFAPEVYRDVFTAGDCAFLTDLMVSVVEQGTGSALRTDDYQAACKTGTAQYETGNDSSHSWIVAFAPAKDPKIAVAVVLEDIGSGSGAANYVARAVLDEYLK